MAVLYSIRTTSLLFFTTLTGDDDQNRFRVLRLSTGYGLASLMPLARNSHVVRFPLPACHLPFASAIFLMEPCPGTLSPTHHNHYPTLNPSFLIGTLHRVSRILVR